MTIQEAMKSRHSVRSYTYQKINSDILEELRSEISDCNSESGLHIQLIEDEPNAFDSLLAHYGKFANVTNYVALVGKKGSELDEKLGWYGERIALKAQQLGLNSCWVAATYSKRKCAARIGTDEKLRCVISLGYGETSGVPHKNKPLDSLCKVEGVMPAWFHDGMEAVLLAPTAQNQQKFLFSLLNNKVLAISTGGFFSKVDLGIVKYHFETGAGNDNFAWQ